MTWSHPLWTGEFLGSRHALVGGSSIITSPVSCFSEQFFSGSRDKPTCRKSLLDLFDSPAPSLAENLKSQRIFRSISACIDGCHSKKRARLILRVTSAAHKLPCHRQVSDPHAWDYSNQEIQASDLSGVANLFIICAIFCDFLHVFFTTEASFFVG